MTKEQLYGKPFVFHALRFEEWCNQQCTSQGMVDIMIKTRVSEDFIDFTFDNKPPVQMYDSFSLPILGREDILTDRIQYGRLPDLSALPGLLSIIKPGKPFVCNLFYNMTCVRFAMLDPLRIVEFYGNYVKQEENMDLHDFVFYSGHHYRFENGIEVGGGAAKRAIRIEDNISGDEGYSVTIFDTEESSVLSPERVSMSTKPMKIVSSSVTKTEMRGWGIYRHPLVGIQIPFSNYGLTVHHPEGQVVEIILHMFDRNIDIKYKL